jgi:uncharacterized membrane protein YcaP (DUF421 family)
MLDTLTGADWRRMFALETPLLEIVVRGTLVYLALLILLRLVLKRERGNASLTDLLVLVLLADSAQNALADDYQSIPDGLLLVGTILFWNYALNWLGYHIPLVGKLVHPDPLPLVKDGQVIHRNLRRELITVDELETLLREQGVEDMATVKGAFLEGDGQVSVTTGGTKAEAGGSNQGRRDNPPGL